MSSNTPNLGLLKKDPMVDGNETFNIETMLNENWDKVDEAVGQVREELGNIDVDIPEASLTEKGIVQLSSATNGTRENVAATEKAVAQAFHAGNERKAEVVAALVAIGIQASTSETWAQLIPKIGAVIRATGNATAADILAGKTASNASGPVTGTIPVLTGTRAATGTARWPDGALAVYPEQGYQKGGSGDGEIKVTAAQLQAAEPNLKPWHYRSDVNMFGLQGAIPIRRPDIDSHINADGNRVSFGPYSTGTSVPYLYLGVPNGYLLEGVEWVRHHEPNLHSGNVKNGVSMFNGQLVGSLIDGVNSAKYATGSVTVTSNQTSYLFHELVINTLTFTPKLVICHMATTGWSKRNGTAFVSTDYGAFSSRLAAQDSFGSDRGGSFSLSGYTPRANGFTVRAGLSEDNAHSYTLTGAVLTWLAFG